MSHTPHQSASPTPAHNNFFLRNHDMIPLGFLSLLIFSYALYYVSPPHSVAYAVCKNLLMPASNLGILLYLILSRALPGLVEFLKTRRQEITDGIVSFNERDDVIAQKYHEIKEKLANVDEEKKSILERAQKLAGDEGGELRDQADRKSKRRLEEVRNQIEQEIKRMEGDMQRTLLEKSFEEAYSLLQKEIKDDDQRRLQEDYLQKLGAES